MSGIGPNHRWRRARWIGAGVLLALVASFAVLFTRGSDRMSVAALDGALRNGSITLGSAFPVERLPAPWRDEGWHLESGPGAGVYAARDRRRVVLVYYRDHRAFAACTVGTKPGAPKTWHFCDDELMREHTEGPDGWRDSNGEVTAAAHGP